MTITTNLSSVTRDGNGATTSFPFDFWVPSADELQFWITDASGVLAQTTNCTVDLSGSGGTVIYPAVGGTILPSGATITIMRDMEFTQNLDLVNATPFHAEVIEGALDRLTAQIQQVDEAVSRAVKVSVSSDTDPGELLNELASDVAAAAASASTATAQAALAVDAKEAAEAAAASVPTFGAFGLTLAGSTTASGARADLELGGAALLDIGTAAGTVCAGDDSRFDDIGSDERASNIAIRNAIKLGILANDASGPIPSGYLWLFKTDELATKTGAAYTAANRSYHASPATYVQYTPTGSTFGDLSANGGLAAAFDGNTNQAFAACAGKNGASGYCGKAFSSAQPISRVGIFGSNNAGYNDVGSGSITVNIYGKSSAPANLTDGTVLGTLSFSNTSNESTERTIDLAGDSYQYIWGQISETGGAYCYFGEIRYYTTATVNNMTLIPAAVTVGANKTKLDVLFLHHPIDSVTLDTDIKARASANDGTNWSGYATLENLGAYDANNNLIRASFSGLTAGTNVKTEITTYNAKAQSIGPIGLIYAA